jgi:nitroreductase
MNILLTIHNLGLGAVYMTGYNNKETEITEGIKKALNLSRNIMPVVLIPLGYPDPSEEIEEKEFKRNVPN